MSSHKTRTGLVLGTPAYMSPEQCEGRATVDHRTDIYALGVVLYEMLVGRVPFIGEGYGEILVQHLTQAPVPPSQYRMMSPHVEQVVLKALEKRAEMRFPTMDEFIRAMTDPVGYVESHGGLTGFAQRQLMPSSAPLPPVARLTPPPMSPVPGQMTPAPGALTAGMMAPTPNLTPTTLSAAAGQVQPTKSKTPFLIAAVATVAIAAGTVVVLLAKKDSAPAAGSGTGSNTVGMTTGSQEPHREAPPPPPPDIKGSQQEPRPESPPPPPPPDTKGSADGKEVKDVVTLSAVTITSNPPGADILINGAAIGKKTPATLNLPMGKDVNVLLKLSGHADFKKALVIDQEKISFEAPLRKVASTSGKHTGGTKGNGKGSSSRPCDTCLERPD
jgi:serine/threonine-protein kinase